MNKFINSKLFDVLVYTVGGTVLLTTELKRLAISTVKHYTKSHGKKV
jgi:hypothetical protein